MLGENHSLANEFPQYKDRIHQLKLSDEEFARMTNEYNALVHQIRGLEMNGVPVSDSTFTAMKMQGLRLKDKLYHRLTID